ncbi:MAG: hypothetical protein JRI94_14305 [Deltaproteobacteria bacterium]|nr:hypothetical protein [Deltaproteobacteria bacterium]MBW2034729.1 hypothetical protein [Deltaproteobacteria bacterium]MBW2170236.1 hypothetical protein [Deltaproteobacteria bacterium]
MTGRLLGLADRIRDEIVELTRIVDRVRGGWQRSQQSEDDLYLDSVALNLHGFYGGLERLFELVASTVDGSVPQGANWHRLLLEQMASEIRQERPAVISAKTITALDEYRGFRHIVRNVYTFMFDPEKVEKLVEKLPGVFKQVQTELLGFADFLEQQVQKGE